MGTDLSEIVGRTIESLYVSDDDGILTFITDDGQRSYIALGDCCSTSWFADITGVDALIGGKVAACEVAPLDDYDIDDGRCREDVDEAYGWIVTTGKGRATIVFRNSSNGYYGGWCDYNATEQDVSKMKRITDDWSA